MQRYSFIVGLVLIAASILFAVFGGGGYSTAVVIGLAMLGIIIVTRSRRSKGPRP